jgi:hypothetical protein
LGPVTAQGFVDVGIMARIAETLAAGAHGADAVASEFLPSARVTGLEFSQLELPVTAC